MRWYFRDQLRYVKSLDSYFYPNTKKGLDNLEKKKHLLEGLSENCSYREKNFMPKYRRKYL